MDFNSESQMEDCPTLHYNKVLLVGQLWASAELNFFLN